MIPVGTIAEKSEESVRPSRVTVPFSRLIASLQQLYLISIFEFHVPTSNKGDTVRREKGTVTEVKQTGRSISTIRNTLRRHGVELRGNRSRPLSEALKTPGKGSIRPYYGFCYFQGQVIPDPREYETLLLSHRFWSEGMNPNRIAEVLNSKKIGARSASNWNRNSVVNILKRFEDKQVVIKGDSYELR